MQFYFEEAAIWTDRKKKVLQAINQSGLPLILFGKASVVNRFFLEDVRVPLQFICDNDPEKWGTELWGLEVIPPSRISDIYSAYNVLILVPFEHQIVPQLQNLPVPPDNIFRLDLYFEEADSAAYFQSMRSELENIYSHLADQKSKDTYEAAIRYRINRDPAYICRIALMRSMQYFPDHLGEEPFLHSDEIFVDAGAFTGDTVKSFLSRVQGRYRNIYAFEPDKINYEKLLESTRGVPNIFCCQTAVSDQRGEILFAPDDSSSRVDAAGGEKVVTDTLDHLIGDTPVTYIKMDVEGMECAALLGAEKIIQRRHPKLAICTYHSNADMIQVPALILRLDPRYQLYFRHYTNALVETVCYAV